MHLCNEIILIILSFGNQKTNHILIDHVYERCIDFLSEKHV